MTGRLASLVLASACFAPVLAAAPKVPPTNAPGPSAAAAGRKEKKQPGDALFSTNGVWPLRIEISRVNLEALRRDARKYVPATVTVGETVYKDVAVHLKGAAGSFRGVDDKPALTLNFDKFTPSQKFFGLGKIHLNNSVQDRSYMTELICGQMFREAGVPTPRAAHALVQLNDRKLGLYVLKEGFEKEFLGQHFKQTGGNLYDGGFLREITEPLERDGGDGPNDRADLKALAAAAQERDTDKRWEKLREVLDVPRFISFMVVENLTWDWDGYVMKKNNYRIYHDPGTGRMTFMPHGLDQMFEDPNAPIFANFNGLVAQAVIKTPQGRMLYRQRYNELFNQVFSLEKLTNQVNELAVRLKPALASANPHAAREFDGQARRMRDLISQRWASVARQLGQAPSGALRFHDGRARLENWARQDAAESARLDQVQDRDGRAMLTIVAQRETTASWRSRITLTEGHYRFEARARAAGIKPLKDEKGEGAGIRISGTEQPRANSLAGDSDWKRLEFEFTVDGGWGEIELVCELRAQAGQVWFARDSLLLTKLK